MADYKKNLLASDEGEGDDRPEEIPADTPHVPEEGEEGLDDEGAELYEDEEDEEV